MLVHFKKKDAVCERLIKLSPNLDFYCLRKKKKIHENFIKLHSAFPT